MDSSPRSYYAIEHRYGIACDERGNRIGTWHRFSSLRERSAWLRDGQPYRTNPGYREPISASDRELRRLLANAFDRVLIATPADRKGDRLQ